jgi:MerR family transcriptional regulator/heat shock protein HspR
VMDELDVDTPVFAIAVAAELAFMHPQTLRQYDRMGLVIPTRTGGQSRRYTMRNVAQLREIARLSNEGVSLEGIKRILELENQSAELQKRVRDLEQALANELMNRPGARVFAAGDSGIETLAPGQRPTRHTSVVVWRRR